MPVHCVTTITSTTEARILFIFMCSAISCSAISVSLEARDAALLASWYLARGIQILCSEFCIWFYTCEPKQASISSPLMGKNFTKSWCGKNSYKENRPIMRNGIRMLCASRYLVCSKNNSCNLPKHRQRGYYHWTPACSTCTHTCTHTYMCTKA